MEKYLISPMAVLTAITFASSKIYETAEDIMGQQKKTMRALQQAQDKVLELAGMKDKYSINGAKL